MRYHRSSLEALENMAFRLIWRIAATVSLFTFALMVPLSVIAIIIGPERFNNAPDLVRIPLDCLGVFTAISTLGLWIGMMFDCLLFSRLSVFSRLKWLLMMLVINFGGAFIYYFKVFNKRGSHGSGYVVKNPENALLH
jgi:hypothetical protein